MEYRPVANSDIRLSVLALGTWAFGGDKWWGRQDEGDSRQVLDAAVCAGVTTIDTAPVYGRGRSERVIGEYIKKSKVREKVVLATKLGLSWDGPKIFHNLKRKRMLEEFDSSRTRLQTDYFDIYQVHWPDADTPIPETAGVMHEFYNKGLIRAVGVSNYSVAQMEEFMKYSPIHTLQPPYNMFRRQIEKDIVPFCERNNISILSYVPLHSGILTGKFFFGGTPVPDDLCRKNQKDLKEPFFSINKKVLGRLIKISEKYGKTLTQLVINWTSQRKGISSVLAGIRNIKQLDENISGVGWNIESRDRQEIDQILSEREVEISALKF